MDSGEYWLWWLVSCASWYWTRNVEYSGGYIGNHPHRGDTNKPREHVALTSQTKSKSLVRTRLPRRWWKKQARMNCAASKSSETSITRRLKEQSRSWVIWRALIIGRTLGVLTRFMKRECSSAQWCLATQYQKPRNNSRHCTRCWPLTFPKMTILGRKWKRMC